MRLVGVFSGGERDGQTYMVHPDEAKAGALFAMSLVGAPRKYRVVARGPGAWTLAPDFSAIVVFDLYEG